MSNSLKKIRERAFESQEGKCFYCEFPMWLADPSTHPLWTPTLEGPLRRLQCTAEHKQARMDGGSDARLNVVAACRFCNMARHRRPQPLSARRFKMLVDSRIRQGKWHSAQLHSMHRTQFVGS